MKEKDVIEELKRSPLKVFRSKRYPNVKLEVVNGKVDLSKLIYVPQNEEWEEVSTKIYEEIQKCSCHKLGESLNSGMKRSNCGRGL